MITQAERNAALIAAHAEAIKVIAGIVPPMFQGFALNYINQHPELIRDISDACLNAADKVSSHEATPPTPVQTASVQK